MPEIPYINIHTHNGERSKDVIAIQNVFAKDISVNIGDQGQRLSAGLHPWHIDEATVEDDLVKVKNAARSKKVIAIGETGLDRKTSASWELQKEVFVRHINIATHSGKPLIIHCVKAYSEVISIVRQAGFSGKPIFHGFNQNSRIAGELLRNGFYLSFGPALLNERSNAATFIAETPTERLFLETDDSEISIHRIYQRAAELKKTDIETLKRNLLTNFTNVFKFEK